MKMNELFLEQLERETASTRKALERVPPGFNAWKPHEKSMAFGYLSALVASMPGWIDFMVNREELDITAPAAATFRAKEVETNAELLAALDEAVGRGKSALEGTNDEHLSRHWKLVVSGRVVSDQPRYVAIGDAFTHLAHHRGQLTVYLRLLNAPVPAIYGPSADDRSF